MSNKKDPFAGIENRESSPAQMNPEKQEQENIVDVNGFKIKLRGPGFEEEDKKKIEEAYNYSHKIKNYVKNLQDKKRKEGRKTTQDGIKIVSADSPEGKNINDIEYIQETQRMEDIIDAPK